jgi:hypothetical protein
MISMLYVTLEWSYIGSKSHMSSMTEHANVQTNLHFSYFIDWIQSSSATALVILLVMVMV